MKCNAVDIERFAIGSVYPNKLRREVQHLPELCFLFADFVFGPLAIFNVGEDAIPFDDVASVVSQGDATLQVPAKLPVRAADTDLVLTGLAAGNVREPLRLVSLKIIRVSYGLPTRS